MSQISSKDMFKLLNVDLRFSTVETEMEGDIVTSFKITHRPGTLLKRVRAMYEVWRIRRHFQSLGGDHDSVD